MSQVVVASLALAVVVVTVCWLRESRLRKALQRLLALAVAKWRLR